MESSSRLIPLGQAVQSDGIKCDTYLYRDDLGRYHYFVDRYGPQSASRLFLKLLEDDIGSPELEERLQSLGLDDEVSAVIRNYYPRYWHLLSPSYREQAEAAEKKTRLDFLLAELEQFGYRAVKIES